MRLQERIWEWGYRREPGNKVCKSLSVGVLDHTPTDLMNLKNTITDSCSYVYLQHINSLLCTQEHHPMLPSNTNIPEVDNAPSWYPCQPMPSLYTTVLYIHVYARPLGCTWLVSLTTTHTQLRWVKASSECIVRDAEVCKGITIICGRFVTIYGGWMAAVWKLLSFASSVIAISLYCIGFCYWWLWTR